MSSKGLNQVDFAVAAAIMVILFAFTIRQVSGYYSVPIQASDNIQMRSQARNLWEAAFAQEGVPPDWNQETNFTRPSMGDRLWKVPVYLKEYNGTGGNYAIRVPVEVGEAYRRPKAWNGSVIAYHNGEALPTDLDYNESQEESGFLNSFDVTFEININGLDERKVDVYYSQDSTVDVNHSNLDADNATVNITVVSEKGEKSISRHKATLMENMHVENISNAYGISHGFRMQFASTDGTVIIGKSVPDDVDVETYTESTLYQSKNGTVDVISPGVVVW